MIIENLLYYYNLLKKYKQLQKDFKQLKKQYLKIIKDNSRLTILNHKYKLIILKRRKLDWADYNTLYEML